MTDRNTIQHFVDALGVDIPIKHRVGSDARTSDSYKVRLGKHQTLDALRYMIPYLVTKKLLATQLLEERDEQIKIQTGSREIVLG